MIFCKLLGDCYNGRVTNTFLCKLHSLTAKKRCVINIKSNKLHLLVTNPLRNKFNEVQIRYHAIRTAQNRVAFKGKHN